MNSYFTHIAISMAMTVAIVGYSAYPTTAIARPVSYPGGWTLMQEHDNGLTSIHLHYSPTASYSIGYKGEYWDDSDWQFHGAQLNILAKRWNQPGSQANFYIKSAAGVAYRPSDDAAHHLEPAAFTGISYDWEDRRWFFMYENRATYAGDTDSYFSQKARIGVAPYIGNYGDIHTWLMLQVEHQPENADPFTFTPMVRVFKGDYLLETGISEHGNVLINFIKRF